MKKGEVFLIGIIPLLVLLFFVSADFVDTGDPVQNVSDCGTLNTSDAVYTLNQSISSLYDCIIINATNVTLDCNGYNITYGNSSGGRGIAVVDEDTQTGLDNVTIQNCIVIQNESGAGESAIFFGESSENGVVYNTTITTYGDETHGIVFETNSVNANVSLNNITTSGNASAGVLIWESGASADVSNNVAHISGNDSIGILLSDDSANGTLFSNSINYSGNRVSGIASAGIVLDLNNDNINISSNNITTSGYDVAGIWIWGENSSIEGNTITCSGELGDGIYLNDVYGINLTSNTINLSGYNAKGIHSEMSEDASLIFYSNSITTSNTYSYGISINQDYYSNISANNITTSGNYAYGIYLEQAHNNTITNNRIETESTTAYVMFLEISGGNFVYNNIFNTSTDGSGVFIENSDLSSFNTTNTTSTNIIGKTYLGGNFWTNVNSTGYSDYCVNLGSDYFCDFSYRVISSSNDNIDYLPLTNYQTNLSACGDLNVRQRYVLNQSLSSEGTCFNITANGVLLDFAGYNITGNTTGYGVNITGYNDTTIFNGSILNFSNGIYLSSSLETNITLLNVSSTENNSDAVVISTSDNTTLYSNIIWTSGNLSDALDADNSFYCNLTENNFTTTGDTSDGVDIYNFSYSTLLNNTIEAYGNSIVLDMEDSLNNTLNLNFFNKEDTSHINSWALQVTSSTGNVFSSNRVHLATNLSFAIALHSQSNDTLFYNNTINATGYSGIGLALYETTGKVSGVTAFNNNILASDTNASLAVYLVNATSNSFFNNIFNSTPGNLSGVTIGSQLYSADNLTNDWNYSETVGTSKIGGTTIGGNYWATPAGEGYSDTCTDADDDDICDSAYTPTGNNTDYLPLTLTEAIISSSSSSSSSSGGGGGGGGATTIVTPTQNTSSEESVAGSGEDDANAKERVQDEAAQKNEASSKTALGKKIIIFSVVIFLVLLGATSFFYKEKILGLIRK